MENLAIPRHSRTANNIPANKDGSRGRQRRLDGVGKHEQGNSNRDGQMDGMCEGERERLKFEKYVKFHCLRDIWTLNAEQEPEINYPNDRCFASREVKPREIYLWSLWYIGHIIGTIATTKKAHANTKSLFIMLLCKSIAWSRAS